MTDELKATAHPLVLKMVGDEDNDVANPHIRIQVDGDKETHTLDVIWDLVTNRFLLELDYNGAPSIKRLYLEPDGDRWHVCDQDGKTNTLL